MESTDGGRTWYPLRAARPSSTRRFLGIWNWDCAFMALAMAKWDANLARDQFRAFARLQASDGMYPDFHQSKLRARLLYASVRKSLSPSARSAAQTAHASTGGFVQPANAKGSFIRQQSHRRRPGDTLFHYDGEAMDEKTRRLYTGWESGMDDSPRWDGGRPWQLWPVDLNCYMVMSGQSALALSTDIAMAYELVRL